MISNLSKQYKIGIVILTYNYIDFTRNCLNSIKAITYPHYEIVVVDNNSHDGTPNIIPAEFPEVHFLPQSENTGFTGGNNIGISWCLERDLDAILLLNNDTIVKPDFLSWMAEHLDNKNIVTPHILSLMRPEFFGAYMGEFNWTIGAWKDHVHGKPAPSVCPAPYEVGMASGCCLLIHRQIFEKIGVFDEKLFLYFEDIDLITRAKLSGFKLMYEPRAIIYHNERTSTGNDFVAPTALYYNVRNRLFIMRKYRNSSKNYFIFIIYFIVNRLLKVIYWLLTGKWKLVLAEYRGVKDFLWEKMYRANYKW